MPTITTRFLSALGLALMALLVQSAPSSTYNTKRFIEQYPWQIRNLTIFNARAGSPGVSYISFLFQDNNTGISTQTWCNRFILPGTSQSVVDPGRYYSCANDTVAFQLTQDKLYLERSYIDPSVGGPGMDHVTAFGNTNATWPSKHPFCGQLQQVDSLVVLVTSIIA